MSTSGSTGEAAEPALVHREFAAWVERTPEADALAWEGGSLTYRELAARAGQLVRRMRSLGVGPGTLAAVLLERSPDAVVSLLGVLEAGAAYLPLDPAYPLERLDWMLADSGAAVLLTREDLARRLSSPPWGVIHVGSDGAERDDAPDVDLGPHDLAYVIYTSGSTGRPKGVQVPHGALAHHGDAVRRLYGLVPGDRVLQFASFSFDVAAEEVFATLASGAALVLRPDPLPDSFAGFSRFVERAEVTVLNLPASYWHAWVDEMERTGDRPPASVRLVIAGNEAVLASRLAAWRRLAGERVRWLNAYGPTEATITATVHEPPAGAALPVAGIVPIGRPLARVRALVLDPGLRPVPADEAGELCLGGSGLARGYLGRPELTAERFVPDPSTGEAGARLYRTGDLVRARPDGEIEFLGRIDDQVKVRGFRIEPGEIEAALLDHPAVSRAAVVACEAAPGDARLAAYVVLRRPEPPVRELRSFLRERLPEPLIPSWIVRLDELPLLPGGKVDRRALPAPQAEAGEERIPPATATEEVLAGLFAEILGIPEVGIHDSFFELGGHSLLATRLVARVREAFRVELPLPGLFEAPTVASLAAAVERAAQDGAAPELPPILRRPRPGLFPLSFPQERVWFLSQLAPHSIAYNTQLTVRFRGPLDVPAFAASLAEIVRRHEIFRTSFEVRDGQPVQRVHPPAPLELPVVDLSGMPAAARAAESAELARCQALWHFDLARPPLVRWTLLRLAGEEHLLIQVEHHFVHDGWSLSVLFREMQQIYRAFAEGRPSSLPELPVQFADFAAWQREWMQGEVLEAQLTWWRQRLAGMPPALELPTDRPRPKAQSFLGEGRTLTIPGPLFVALRDLSRRHGATPYMTWLAAFQVLLMRYTGQEDLVVGSSVANRRLRETEDLIGMIVNNLVLRTDLSGDPPFAELLARVRETTLGAYAHQDVPFEKLVETLQPERDLGRNPLFQVAFGFHDSAMPDLDFGAMTGRIDYTFNDSAKFDLNLVVVPPREPGEEVRLLWESSTDLFHGSTIARMHGHLRTLLEGVASRPEARVGELPLLHEAERHQVLVEWNETAAGVPWPALAHELFEEQAAARPDALAVAGGGRRLSYSELDARANLLAHRLIRLGVGPEVTVALLLERSPEIAAAILGVLKAGGAYLPLDPAYPPERLAFMVEDSGAPVILVDKETIGHVPEVTGQQVVLLDPEWSSLAPESAERPSRPKIDGDGTAYVIYTSGSTGRPKGVQISHANLMHLVAWHRSVYGVTPGDRATQIAGLAFDASVWEVWPYLTAGASLHIPDEETRSTPPRLAEWLVREGITLTFLPTPLAEALLEEPWPAAAPLRALLTGGDRLRRRPRPDLPFAVFNHYGPTEGTVVATAGLTATHGDNAPSIGRPIANARAYLLDLHRQPAPIGVPGELCVGGRGLARGYGGRPDLTAERFVPDDVSGEAGGRLYRTGDLVRWRTDGRVEFLGRIDHQVKLRGFRIELGEIEAALAGHPAVREAVALVREDAPGDRRLVAYVVSDVGVPAGELAEHCRRKLPEYMVPWAFVPLPALPLSPNGKLDRAALPPSEGAAGESFVPPSGPVEEVVAGLFSRALGVERVGANDGFFSLGGHSLMATRLLFQIGQAFRVEVPLHAFFDQPTAAGVARALTDREARPGQCEAAARLLQRLEGMSPEEVTAMLHEKRAGREERTA